MNVDKQTDLSYSKLEATGRHVSLFKKLAKQWKFQKGRSPFKEKNRNFCTKMKNKQTIWQTNQNCKDWIRPGPLFPQAKTQMKICSKITFFYKNFCTKMKFLPLFMIFVGTGGCQDYFVCLLSCVSPQARGTSVKSRLIQSVRTGMHGKFMSVWGIRLRSSPAIITGQGQINRVIPVSECL